MEYLNIVLGLGGTGLEVVHDFLEIQKRYPISETNDLDWFIIDTADPQKQADFSNFSKTYNDKLIKLETFNDANKVVKQIKTMTPESNIEEIFPIDGKIREEGSGNDQGAWVKRKLGYLSLLYHILKSKKNIIDKLKELLTSRGPQRYDKINFFFICSIAGGTGSGILLPLNVLVKNLMDNGLHNNVAYYHLLATPEAVAQGSREPNNEKVQEHFQANAYQSLREIDLISKATTSNDLNWQVKLTGSTKLAYNSSMGNLMDNVFLFHDKNVGNIGLSHCAKPEDAYKPEFHLMAWSLFILNSINVHMMRDVGNLLNANPKNPFIGMGAHILEYPQNDILRKCAHILLKNINENLANFRNISEEKINNRIENFHLPVENFKKTAKFTNNVNKNLKNYRRKINQYTDKSQKSTLISLEPQISLPNTDRYSQEFREKLNKSVDNMLKTDMFTLLDLKIYLNGLKRKVIQKKKTLENDVKSKNNIIQNLKGQLNKTRRIKTIKRNKTGKCFKNKYDLKLYENAIELLEKNKNYLSELINYLHKILKVFEASNFIEDSEYCNEQDPYFKYLPLQRTYEDLDKISSNIMQELYEAFQEEHLATNANDLRTDELKQKILNDFWILFSKKYSENFADLINNFVKKSKEKINNKNLIKKYEEDLIEYLRKGGRLREKNNIIEKINGGLKSKKFNLEIAEPYINIQSLLASNNNEKFIACSSNNKDNIDTSNLEDFSGKKIYEIIPHDNIVVFCELAGKFTLEQLNNVDTYKEKYNRKIKSSKTKWYRFIDPCFEKFENRQ